MFKPIMTAASPILGNTPRRSPRTLQRDWTGSETCPSVMQDRLSYEPKKVVEASCRKRKRTTFNSSQSGNQSKPEKGVYRMAEQYEQAPMYKDDRIRSLEEEIKALKNENEALKKRLLKEHACPICRRSYNRSDGLYKHLREGDKEHRRLAQERYDTKCEICGKECARWGDLKKHMAIHEQKELGSADDLNLESDATSPSSNPSSIASMAQESVSSATSLAVDEGPILERAWPPDISTSLTSEDPTTNCQPSTPCLKLAPGFSNSPVRGLDFAAPSYTHPSLYNDKTVIVQAPGFLNNPARELDFAPFDYTHQSLYNSDIANVQAPGFLNSPARGLDFAPPGYTHPSLYNSDTVNVQAPGFSNSPARGPNFAPSGYTHQSLYNSDAVNVQAPGFLNSPARGLDFAPPTYTQSSLYNKNTVIMQAPGFSESSARGLEFAPSNSTRPSLYNTITLEAPSFWSRPFIAGPNPTSTNKPDGVLNYTSICGAHPQGTISCPQADSQGTVQSMGITQLSRIL